MKLKMDNNGTINDEILTKLPESAQYTKSYKNYVFNF